MSDLESSQRRKKRPREPSFPRSEDHTPAEIHCVAKRVAKACTTCRSRKTRCDARLPRCSFCMRHDLLCDYEAQVVRPQPSRARDSGIGSTVDDHQHLLHRILDRLDSLEERISGLSNPHIPLAPPLQAPEDDRNDQQSLGKVRPHTGQPVEPSHILASDSRQVNLRDLSSDKAPHSTWWKATLEDTLEWPVLQFRGNTKRALEATMIYEHKESELYAASEDRLYDKKVISHLVELFIEEVHTKNPILEISQVQKHTAHVLKTGIGHDMETCFVLLYCALGAISCPFSPCTLHRYSGNCTTALRYHTHDQYFAAAQVRFGTLWRQSRLKHGQGLFLAGVYLMYCMRPWKALETFRSASIVCLKHMMAVRAQRDAGIDDLGESVDHGYEFDPPEQRLYWSCLKSETELAHEYGLDISPLAQLADPPSLPTPPNPLTNDGILTSKLVIPLANPALVKIQEKSWYYYLTEISLRKLEIQIHASFERLQDEIWPLPVVMRNEEEKVSLRDFLDCIVSGISEFETQLQSCWDRLSSAMDIELEDVKTGCPDELCEYLRIKFFWIKHDLLRIALNIILHLQANNSQWVLASEFPGLNQTLVRMANDGLSVSVNIMQVGINTHRNHGSWFGPRITVMSALEVIAARKSGNPHLKIPHGFESAARSLSAALEWWQPQIPDADHYMKILSILDPIFE